MDAKKVRVNFRYGRAVLKTILQYARRHNLQLGGRYDFRYPPHLNIWTHHWGNYGCMSESSVMFSLEFDWHSASLMSVTLWTGFDWAIFLDELARLERAALGETVYGKSRCEQKKG